MNTFFANEKHLKSLWQNTYAQFFMTQFGFVFVLPLKTKYEDNKEIKSFFKEVGVSPLIFCDSVPKHIQGDTGWGAYDLIFHVNSET